MSKSPLPRSRRSLPDYALRNKGIVWEGSSARNKTSKLQKQRVSFRKEKNQENESEKTSYFCIFVSELKLEEPPADSVSTTNKTWKNDWGATTHHPGWTRCLGKSFAEKPVQTRNAGRHFATLQS